MFVGLLLVTLGAPACSTEDDSIWMPPGGDGKADGYTTIHGGDIPSAYADGSKSYMLSRQIASLATVGALDADGQALAKRIDGIIANLPADGKLSLAELVRMEDPTIMASLFPAEKAMLPTLWKLVEAPDSDSALFGAHDNFGAVDSSLPPAAAVPPETLAITTLATALQAPATRLENKFDNDNNAATVSLDDLAMGVANPASFTTDEINAFKTTQAVFRAQAVAASDAKLVISPGPGAVTKDGTLGPATFHMTGTTTIEETRSVYSNQMQLAFTATQAINTTVTLAADTQVVVIDQDAGGETVFGAGDVPSLARGNYVFETWKNGTRSFSTNATLPATTTKTPITLTDKLDYTLSSGLAPLVRNLASATQTYTSGTYSYATRYTYDKAAATPPATVAQAALDATSTPVVTLPVGRYSFPQQGGTFYVYPNNVLWFDWHGTTYRLLPVGNNGNKPTRFVGQSATWLTFDVSTSQLNSTQQPAISVRLDGSMRDI